MVLIRVLSGSPCDVFNYKVRHQIVHTIEYLTIITIPRYPSPADYLPDLL